MTASFLSAAPFAEWIDARSPKGAPIRIWGEGDEFSARFEAEDGHTVVFNPEFCAYVYAEKDPATGALRGTAVCVGDETPSDRTWLTSIPLHLHDTSEAAATNRERLMEEDEQIFGTRRKWRELKDRHRRRPLLKTSASALQTATALAATAPARSEIVGLTLLIDFPMTNSAGVVTNTLASATHPDITVSQVGQLINGENCSLWGNDSSVRKYYEDASCGKLCYTNIVIGWITVDHPREYYDDVTKSSGTQGRLLIGDVLGKLASSSDYSTKYLPLLRRVSYSGTKFLALNVFFAGLKGSVWSKGLWAHKSSLNSTQYKKALVEVDGSNRHFYAYQISPLTKSPSIGTFCHENGHMILGFPDLYSYDDGCGNGTGSYCLMSYHGSTALQYICPYLRMLAGWITPKEMPSDPARLVVSNRLDDVWKYANPNNPAEYYLVENRQRRGRDMILPSRGILIWRCNEDGDNTHPAYLSGFSGNAAYRRNNEVSLEQADGLYLIEQGKDNGDAADSWYKGNPKSDGVFSDTTMPCALWKDGTASGLILAGFSANGTEMSFAFGSIPEKRYRIEYSLGGGECQETLSESVPCGAVFSVLPPVRPGYDFRGWSVSGSEPSVAKWGTTANPATPITKTTDRCSNGANGRVYFRDLTSRDDGIVTLFANWNPESYPSAQGTLFVSELWGDDSKSGTSWASAVASIQKAVDKVTKGARIVVYDGHYAPFSVSSSSSFEIVSVGGPDRTVIDGSLQWTQSQTNRCAYFKSATQRMVGFALENGRADNGGGAYRGTFSNCVFQANAATASGGGAYNCTVSQCLFRQNQAKWGGGSAYGSVSRCRYWSNSASSSGGASYAGTLSDCLLYDNDATWGGGCYTGTLYSCTLVDNSAKTYGGGVAASKIRNCIVWDNVCATGANAYRTDCRHSCAFPLQEGTGNLAVQPQFVDPEHDNFHLAASSPCVDAGFQDDETETIDLDGNVRIAGNGVDMGAYESGASTRSTPLPIDYHWLERYPSALRAKGADYERAATEWRCANGLSLWECYAAGLDPENPGSKLTALIDMSSGTPNISWDPPRPSHTPNAWYRIEGKSSLEDAWSVSDVNVHRFFRVVVTPQP